MLILGYDGAVAQEDAGAEQFLLGSTGYLLARVGMEARRAWGQMLGGLDLTPHQFGMLMALAPLTATSQQQLSRAVGVDPRNAVPIIDALQHRGLLERRPDPADRRRHIIALTPAGQAMIGQLRQSGEELEDWFLGSLTEAERAGLHTTLAKLYATATSATHR
jgi:MarR family transcriptional regulator, lower aerobic nicotinate degradation pathway regulator